MKNIGGDKHDAHYRYKRNIIEIEYQQKQGGLTCVKNMDLIQKQLGMPDEFITAFYKKVKKKGHGMLSPGLYRGSIDIDLLEKMLEKMIVKFVLCPKCGNPEWAAGPRCPACGHTDGQSVAKESTQTTSQDPVESIAELTETMTITSAKPVAMIVGLMKDLYEKRLDPDLPTIDYTRINLLLDMAWKMETTEEFHKLREEAREYIGDAVPVKTN